MFLLPSIGLGLAFALLLGGRPSRLLEVRLQHAWLVVLALAVQVVAFTQPGEELSDELRRAFHLGSYGLLILFAAANLRVRALAPALLGLLLNTVAIAANGGPMPLSPSAAEAAGIAVEPGANVSEEAGRLAFLGDVFALPWQLPIANTFSIGDVLIGFGMAAFIVAVSLEPGGERSLDPRRFLEPVRVAAFRRLAAGRLVSHLGDWLTLASLIGWIYHETGSTGNVALLMISRLAPPILGGSLAAVLVDRLPKQALLVWIELARGAVVLIALEGVLLDEYLAVFVALAVSGVLAAMANAAVPALLPSLLPPERLAAANAGLGVAKDAAMAVGALAAGLALSVFGVVAALMADLATFAAAAALFAGLRGVACAAPQRQERSLGGLRYLLSRRMLVVLVACFATATLATGLVNATLSRFLTDHVGLGPGGYGFGLAAIAAGLALGQALVGFTHVGPTAGRWIGAALLLMAGLLGLLALGEHAPTAFLLLAAIGFVDGTTDVIFDTVAQRETDPRYLGAVFGFASAFITTTMLGSVAIAPLLNGLVDSRWVMLLGACALVLSGMVGLGGMRRVAPAASHVPAPLGSP
jgi:hypothetical protein